MSVGSSRVIVEEYSIKASDAEMETHLPGQTRTTLQVKKTHFQCQYEGCIPPRPRSHCRELSALLCDDRIHLLALHPRQIDASAGSSASILQRTA